MKKLVAGVFTSAVLLSPFIAGAASVTITHTLSVGSKGAEVAALQELLIKLDLLKASVTGYFGAQTRLAVLAFQKANKLPQAGSVGPKTRLLVNAALDQLNAPPLTGNTTPPPAPVPPPPPQTSNTTTVSSSSSSNTIVVATSSPNDPPKLTLLSPIAVVPRSQTELTFAVATDKPATCRYSTQPAQRLAYMTSLVDEGLKHSRVLTGLTPGGLYIYFVRCEDTMGHQSNELQVTFSLTGN